MRQSVSKAAYVCKYACKLVSAILLVVALLGLAGCNNENDSSSGVETLTVGASPAPHARILNFLTYEMYAAGINLVVVEYTDFVQPNTALAAGDIDANFFQHRPFMEYFNEENDASLVPVTGVLFLPQGLYPGQMDSLEDIADGARIAIPSDPSNGGRALSLLCTAGLIVLTEDVCLDARLCDVIENPYNLEFVEVGAAQMPGVLDDVDFAIINGGVAMQAGIDFDTALIAESGDCPAAEQFTNYLVTRSDRENNEAIQRLAELLNSDMVRDFIENRYGGRVIPMF